MLALAFLAVTRAALADGGAGLASSANEIRCMFTALCAPPRDEQHARHWSRWRHDHQERAAAATTSDCKCREPIYLSSASWGFRPR